METRWSTQEAAAELERLQEQLRIESAQRAEYESEMTSMKVEHAAVLSSVETAHQQELASAREDSARMVQALARSAAWATTKTSLSSQTARRAKAARRVATASAAVMTRK